MDFQTVIFDDVKRMFSEDVNDATKQQFKGAGKAGLAVAGLGALGGSAYLMNKGYQSLRNNPKLDNPVYNASNSQTSLQQKIENVKKGISSSNTTQPIDGQSVAHKWANAGDAMGNKLGDAKEATKSIVGHVGDMVAAHPTAALATGAVGTAAWLARRRALKNASRGL